MLGSIYKEIIWPTSFFTLKVFWNVNFLGRTLFFLHNFILDLKHFWTQNILNIQLVTSVKIRVANVGICKLYSHQYQGYLNTQLVTSASSENLMIIDENCPIPPQITPWKKIAFDRIFISVHVQTCGVWLDFPSEKIVGCIAGKNTWLLHVLPFGV